MTIEEMIKVFSSQGRRVSDPLMNELILIYYGAILVNRYSCKKNVTGLSIDIKSFVLFFASSGVGKSFNIKTIEKAVCLEEYTGQMSKVFDIINKDDEQAFEYKGHLPSSPTTLVSGTKEGLFSISRSVSYARMGSLNALNDEIVDAIGSSNELLLSLKQGYDGEVKAKVKAGAKGDRVDSDVTDIVFNFLGAGTLGAASSDTIELLNALIVSGFFRRALVLESKARPEKSTIEPIDMTELKKWFFDLNDSKRDGFTERVKNYPQTGTIDTEMQIDPQAVLYIETIDIELLNRANDDQLSELKQYDTGSLDVIVNIAYIKCYIEGRMKVVVDDLKYAWSLFIRTRETCENTFKEIQSHEAVFDLLTKKDNLTHSDLLALDHSGSIPKQKSAWSDTILLVQELCYRKNKTLKMNKGIVARYTIEDLPKTNLNRLIISLSTDDKRERAIAYQVAEFRWDELPKLAVSHFRTELDQEGEEVTLGVESFCCAHFEESDTTEPYGHRKKDNYIQHANLIGLDFDDGRDTIDSIKEKFTGFKYLLYTTKSHNSKKSNYQDRFRVLIPTAHAFNVNPEQLKQMIGSFAEFFDLSIDSACRNASRLFYTNKDAEVYVNEAETLFDASGFIPDTISAEQLRTKMDNLKEITIDDDDEMERRIRGYVKYMVATVSVGVLRDYIHKMYMFIMDLTNKDLTLTIQALRAFQQGAGFPDEYLVEHSRNHGYEF